MKKSTTKRSSSSKSRKNNKIRQLTAWIQRSNKNVVIALFMLLFAGVGTYLLYDTFANSYPTTNWEKWGPRIRWCVSNNNYQFQAAGSTASGAWGITDEYWAGFGGVSKARLATAALQDQRAYDFFLSGGTAAWHQYYNCWRDGGTANSRPLPDPLFSYAPDPTADLKQKGGSADLGFNTWLGSWDSGVTTEQEYQLMSNIGASIQRTGITWSAAQPTQNGAITFPSSLDDSYKIATSRGIKQIILISSAPVWASNFAGCNTADNSCKLAQAYISKPPTEAHVGSYANFVAAVAKRYPQAIIETWNEPNIQYFWKDKYPYTNTATNPLLMAKMQCAAYDAVKRSNPKQTILGPGVGVGVDRQANGTDYATYMTRMYQGMNGRICWDGVSGHPYNDGKHVGSNTSLAKQIQVMKQTAAAFNDISKIWITETGMSTSGCNGVYGGCGTQSTQDDYLGKGVHALTLIPDVAAVIVHTLRDAGEAGSEAANPNNQSYGYGMLRADRSATPAAKNSYCYHIKLRGASYPTCRDGVAISPTPPTAGAVTNGFSATFYDYVSGATKTRSGDKHINFHWGTGSPQSGIGADNFFGTFKGVFKSPASGQYTFSMEYDDGAVLKIGDTTLFDNSRASGGSAQGQINLDSAKTFAVEAAVFEASGNAKAILYWSGPGINGKQIFPALGNSTSPAVAPATAPTANASAPRTFTVTFFDYMKSIAKARTGDTHINFDWGTGVPISGISADYFHGVWDGSFIAPGTGTYTFNIEFDDGATVKLNETVIIDRWKQEQGSSSAQGTFSLTKGQEFRLTAGVMEKQGNAKFRLYWSGPGITGKQFFPFTEPNAAQQASPITSTPVPANAPTNPTSVNKVVTPQKCNLITKLLGCKSM